MRRNERRQAKSTEKTSVAISRNFCGMATLTRFAEASLVLEENEKAFNSKSPFGSKFLSSKQLPNPTMSEEQSDVAGLSDLELDALSEKQKSLAQLVVSQAVTAGREISLNQGNVVINCSNSNVFSRGSPESAVSINGQDSPIRFAERAETTQSIPFCAISGQERDLVHGGLELKYLVFKRLKCM